MRLQVPASSNLKLFQLILDTYQNVRTICHPPPYPQLWIYLLRNYHSSRKPQIMGTSLLLGSKRLLCSLDGPQLLHEAKRTLLNTYFPLRFHPLCFSKTTDVLRIRRTNADSWCATLSFFSFSLSWSSSSSHPGEDDEVP